MRTHRESSSAMHAALRESHEPRLEPSRPRLRGALGNLLGAILAFGALNAFAGGYYGLSGAKDVPTAWLAGSPFSSYFIPSLLLFVVVGGSLLAGAVAVFARWRSARRYAFVAGVILLVWIAVQLAIIGYVSWMQPTTAIAGFAILALTPSLPSRAAKG
jgi:hypothetical protein